MNRPLKSLILFLSLLASSYLSFAQSFVSITIDDVPNTRKYEKDHFNSKLLNKLESLNIPVGIFINEGNINKTDSISKNLELLDKWVQSPLISIGNHSYSHARFSEVGVERFKVEIEKGELLSKELSKKYRKPLNYFRFPYNDLGKDTAQHIEIKQFLETKNYTIMPFTIESIDWMFNYIYEYYLSKNDSINSKIIGEKYIAITIAYFDFFESLTQKLYGRIINQIYLCHDNSLNADYLELLVQRLINKNYKFISFETALNDNIYNQTDKYYQKWGISWIYRWLENNNQINSYLKSEPDTTDIEKLYGKIISEKKG